MRPHEAAALAAQRDVYGQRVAYTGAGLNGGFVQAIKSEVPADPMQGLSGRARRVSFEIPAAAMPSLPANGNSIEEDDGAAWRVVDVAYLGDVDAYSLVVEVRP